MTVILIVLLLIAAAIVPNLLSMQRSRNLKDLEADIVRLPNEARSASIKTGNPVQIRIDGTTLIVEQLPQNGEPTSIKQVDIGKDIKIGDVQLNGQASDTGTWKWIAYPDGSSDNGGIEFDEGTQQKSLFMTTNGGTQWIKGSLPDPTESQWTAGQLAQRS